MAQTYEDKPTLEAWNALGSPFKLIREVVMEEEGRSLEINLTSIDWGQYAVVCISCEPLAEQKHCTGGTCQVSVYFAVGGGSFYIPPIGENNARATAQYVFFPLYNADQNLAFTTVGMSQAYGTASPNYRLRDMDSPNMQMMGNNGNIAAGSRIRVYVVE